MPGKPRIFMPYAAGLPVYTAECDEVAAAHYRGFDLTPGLRTRSHRVLSRSDGCA